MTKNSNVKFHFLLVNFRSQVSSIELAPGYVIRKLFDAESSLIRSRIGTRIGWYGDFVMEVTLKNKPLKDFEAGYAEVWMDYVDKSIFILRLYKENVIGYGFVMSGPYLEPPYLIEVSQTGVGPDSFELGEGEYVINNGEVEDFKRFFGEFINKPLDDFSLPIRFFNKSYSDSHFYGDALVDLVIVLENLYLKGEKVELGYKLGMRVACLLAKTTAKRKEFFDDIKEAYSLRSSFVHGGKNIQVNFDFLSKIRKYVRQSLQFFIRNPSLKENLDDVILNMHSEGNKKKNTA